MLKKITALFASVCIAAAAISSFTVTASAEGTNTLSRSTAYGEYKDGWYHISNAEQLVALSEESEKTGNPVLTANFVLDNDITLSASYDNQINIAPHGDSPFKGVFDGNGHTISGLQHSTYGTDSGLFAFTDGAEIKNLNIDYAIIKSVNRAGIIVGHAENTKFMNISITNSHLNIMSGGVVLELITANGVTVGGIAGEAIKNCLIYNCETIDTIIDTPPAEGVVAAAGDGYYMGGLVGTLSASHIEYSRVLSEQKTTSGQVKLELTTAISALGARKVYVGGLAGEMKAGATITDSFCNASLISKPSTAVDVLFFVYGYVGGISGAAYGEDTSIVRCHYSGQAEQWDFGGAVIVGASKNNHIGGILGLLGSNTNVDNRFINCYYNYSRITEDKRGADCAVIWRDVTPSIYHKVDPSTCSSYTEEQYANQANSWENNGYDFGGSIVRDTPCNELFLTDNNLTGSHVNQWVMHPYNYANSSETEYANTTMPIHGKTELTIYSNEYNAFTDSYPKNMQYVFTTDDNNTVTLPSEDNLTSIKPNLNNSGFIGIAFVSERNAENGTAYYTCDMLYAPGSKVSRQIIDAYSKDPDKKIYGVWCQAYTVGAQLGLNNTNKGIRVLTAVNTDLLENIGLTKPDQDYFRGATFTVGGKEYMIQADSKDWIGENYRNSFKNINIDSQVENAKVFSIFAAVDGSDYTDNIKYQGDILYNGINENAAEGLFDFLCNPGEISVQEIAQNYISDLEAAGRYEDEHYGLTDEAYNNLMTYAGKTE